MENPAQGNSLGSVEAEVSNSQPDTTTSLENGMAGMLGSNEPGEEPTNNGDNSKGNENGTQTESEKNPAWTSQLAKEVSANADLMKRLTKFNNISDLAKSYAELEGKIGNSLVKPGKDASADEVNAFYEKLGRPKDASGYSLNEPNTEALKELAFKFNLTDDQLKGIHEGLNNLGKQFIENAKANQQRLLKTTDEMLHKEYGNKYSEKIAFMQRGIQNYGGKDLGNALTQAGLLYHPAIVKLFITLGEQSAEAGTVSRGAGGSDNGYKTAAEGGHFSSKF